MHLLPEGHLNFYIAHCICILVNFGFASDWSEHGFLHCETLALQTGETNRVNETIIVLEKLNDSDKLKALSMVDKRGWRPIDSMIVMMSWRGLQFILGHGEINPGNTKPNEQIDHFFDWLQKQQGKYPMVIPPQALIFYTERDTNERPVTLSRQERDAIEGAFGKLKLPMKIVENFTEDNLFAQLKGAASDQYCSGLIVSVMSHGQIGIIADIDNKPILINRIITTMNSEEMQGKPKVLILQACQHYPPLEGSFQRISLKPNDFTLIISAVEGKKAKRNTFIPTLSKYISEAANGETIDSCFEKTRAELLMSNRVEPDIRQEPTAPRVTLSNTYQAGPSTQ